MLKGAWTCSSHPRHGNLLARTRLVSRMGPYGLLRWSLTARLRGCRVVFVSTALGRFTAGSKGASPQVGALTANSAFTTGTFRAETSSTASAFAPGMTESTRISFLACRPVCYRQRPIARDDPSSVSA